MGATSVTGVSGPGSAEGKMKGTDRMTLGVGHLIGTRIYAAGQVTLVAGAATVNFPTIADSIANYLAFATDTNAAATAVNVTALTTNSLVLAGTGVHVINWMIVKIH